MATNQAVGRTRCGASINGWMFRFFEEFAGTRSSARTAERASAIDL
jgi:hypothetical protein